MLHSPAPQDLLDFVQRHAGGCLLVVAGVMEVQYDGRAASSSEAGDYVLIHKSDGSLQLQGARAIKPVNWMPSTDELRVTEEEGVVVVRAERFNPNEVLRVAIHQPAVAQALAVRPDTSFALRGSEREMREALRQCPDWLEAGLTIVDEELPTGVGAIDLYARDAEGAFVVVELKRGKATQEAAHQLQRYVQAVRDVVPGRVRGLLAAPDITLPALKVLERSGLEFKEVRALPVVSRVQQSTLF